MQRIIHVPQGYSARIIKNLIHGEISGLYTEGFSSCNIVACFSKEKMILMHVDFAAAHKLAQELEWVDGKRTIVIIYRENSVPGTILNKLILNTYLRLKRSDDQIQSKSVRASISNVFIAFNLQGFENVPIIRFLSSQPENLIRHPQEQQLLTIQKIEQIVGLQAKIDVQASHNKKINIFDGIAWETMGSNELKININNPKTQDEMSQFGKHETLLALAGKLRDVSLNLTVPIMIEESGYIDVASYLEQYLSNYDYNLLFKRNLKDLFTSEFHKPITKIDKQFNNEMKQITNKDGDIFAEVTEKINTLILSTYKNEYQKSIISEYNMFASYYKERKSYCDLTQNYNQLKQKAALVNKSARQHYIDKNYSAAAEIFFQAIIILTLCSIKDDPSLATSYYNYGKSLYNDQKHSAAEYALSISLELRKNHTNPKPSDIDLEKTSEAMALCKKLLIKPNNLVNDVQETPTGTIYEKSSNIIQDNPARLTPYYKYHTAKKDICNRGTMIIATAATAAMSAYYYNSYS